jgi:three-Cys-motif partner protein
MGESGLQLFGGDWTNQKLDALDQYLRAYAKALKKQHFRRIYIDAFAGTGYREQRTVATDQTPLLFSDELSVLTAPEPQRFLDGSAKIALRVTPPFHQFIFIELDKAKVGELEKLRVEFPSQAQAIDIWKGDANHAIQSICSNWDGMAPGVLFLDPFGMHVEWKTIKAIAETQCIDTWILFPFATNRLLKKKSPEDISAAWRRKLAAFFGTEEWESRFYKKAIHMDIFHGDRTLIEKQLTLPELGAYYDERLRTVFPIVAENPRILLSNENSPLFQLSFAAGNKGRGGQLALEIASYILDNI